MSKILFTLPLIASALTIPLTAHADTIDDFTLSGQGHTLTYSLPSTTTFPEHPHINSFNESSPAAVDGVSGYFEYSTYYPPSYPAPTFEIFVDSPPFAPVIELGGSQFVDFQYLPANNPYPYYPYDVVATFIPGTYNLLELGAVLHPIVPPVPYTLTIAQETTPSAVPEPSTIALFGTGVLGLLLFVRMKSAIKNTPGRPLSHP
jgi:hypothetical protein